MKLIKQQLSIIENRLVEKGINFDDIKIELIDHIASDIEESTIENNINFDDALKNSLKKWDDSFRPATSFFTGLDKYPNIVIGSYQKEIKRQIYFSVVAILISVLIFLLLKKNIDSEHLIVQFKNVMKVIFVLSLFWMIIFKFFLFKENFKTIFSHFALNRLVIFGCFFVPIFGSNIPTTLRNQVMFIILGTVFISHFLFTCYFGYKHFKLQKFYA